MRFYWRKSNVNTNFGTTSLPDIGDQRWINVGINVGFTVGRILIENYSKILNEVLLTLIQRCIQRWYNVRSDVIRATLD